jgi:ABC-type nitrate/sulfonate/bicarbonate transport system substrate-binding protein
VGIFALEKAGLPPGQYENVRGSSTTAQKAAQMDQKLIDAAILTAPTSMQFVAQGYVNVLNTWEYIPTYANDHMLVTESWAKQHQEVLVRYLKAMVRSLRWVNDPASQDEFVERVARTVRQDPRWVREGWQIYQSNNLWPRNGQGSTEALQFAVDYLDQLNVLGGPRPSVEQFHDESYLQRALAELSR